MDFCQRENFAGGAKRSLANDDDNEVQIFGSSLEKGGGEAGRRERGPFQTGRSEEGDLFNFPGLRGEIKMPNISLSLSPFDKFGSWFKQREIERRSAVPIVL